MKSPPTLTWQHSSSAFVSTEVLDPQPSRLVLRYWYAAHGLAVASLLFGGLPLPPVVFVSMLLGLAGFLRRPQTPPRVVVQVDGSWTVPAWNVVALRPGPGSFRTPWIVRVVLASPVAGRQSVLLARDALPAAQWRRLQVLLACGPLNAERRDGGC